MGLNSALGEQPKAGAVGKGQSQKGADMTTKTIETKADLIAALSEKGRFMFYGDEHPLIYVLFRCTL